MINKPQPLRDEIDNQVYNQVRVRIYFQDGNPVLDQVSTQVWNQVWRQVLDQVREEINDK